MTWADSSRKAREFIPRAYSLGLGKSRRNSLKEEPGQEGAGFLIAIPGAGFYDGRVKNLLGRRGMGSGLCGVMVLACTAGLMMRMDALVFYSSGATTFNASAPTGSLANSGWQFQGRWGSFLGTPVARSFFLTAKHVGGSVGGVFSWNGVNYTTVAKVDHPTADLTLWRVSGTFPSFAPLYTAGNEVGKPLVVFGRSAARGAAVTVTNASPGPLRGWAWGSAGGGTVRWGQNTVEAVTTLGGASYLVAAFDRSGGVNEATLAGGDSGGAVFIQDGGTWKLAGINYAVQADFAATATGASFKAAIFDAGGLYYGANLNQRFLVEDLANDQSAAWLATRVSSYGSWIKATAGLP